eukprot:TRINITY_DN4826_c0_g1_i1.p1 TRINITY_DN4826_c0_g1~~TRINITY_DN4826_c0_g1_i1.p1  ORF type:complete len:374 (-),score=52.33 TRINITY_DN4826_c0_g1_i1:89-1210(-)
MEVSTTSFARLEKKEHTWKIVIAKNFPSVVTCDRELPVVLMHGSDIYLTEERGFSTNLSCTGDGRIVLGVARDFTLQINIIPLHGNHDRLPPSPPSPPAGPSMKTRVAVFAENAPAPLCQQLSSSASGAMSVAIPARELGFSACGHDLDPNKEIVLVVYIHFLYAIDVPCILSSPSLPLSPPTGRRYASSSSPSSSPSFINMRADPLGLSDVTLNVGGLRFPVHKCILAYVSPYFARLLAGGMLESRSRDIVMQIPDIEGVDENMVAHVFSSFLDYIYSQEYPSLTSADEHMMMFKIADMFGVDPLRSISLSHIISCSSSEDVPALLCTLGSYPGGKEFRTLLLRHIYISRRLGSSLSSLICYNMALVKLLKI